MSNININSFFIISVAIIYVVYTIILIKVKRIASRKVKLLGQEKYINPYARKDSRVLLSLIFIEVVLFFLYIFKIDFIIYFNFIIPDFLRFLAILLGISGVFIIGLASFTLDGEFSETIELKEGHRLITNGPYKYIRHPIYSGFIILHLGVTIALSNLIIFIIYNIGLLILLIERIPKEEKVLHLYFGKSYEEYCKRTGRFIPKIKKDDNYSKN